MSQMNPKNFLYKILESQFNHHTSPVTPFKMTLSAKMGTRKKLFWSSMNYKLMLIILKSNNFNSGFSNKVTCVFQLQKILSSLHGGSLEITLTVPLIKSTKFSNLFCKHFFSWVWFDLNYFSGHNNMSTPRVLSI